MCSWKVHSDENFGLHIGPRNADDNLIEYGGIINQLASVSQRLSEVKNVWMLSRIKKKYNIQFSFVAVRNM